ncbi:MAG: hypothetical protein HKN82_05885 [Akkermansiaceae bacterium]|nr:hypothetical protein [Akkermansiaceae bacterium]
MNAPNVRHLKFASLAAALAAVILSGCAVISEPVTIPKEDKKAPRVSLSLSGPGLDIERMSNPPSETWTGEDGGPLFDLEADSEYKFRMTVRDSGGAGSAWLYLPRVFEVVGYSPSTVKMTTSGATHRLVVDGDRKEPRLSIYITGKFRTPKLGSSETVKFTLAAFGYDFGGEKNLRNGREMRASASVNVAGAAEAKKAKAKDVAKKKTAAAEKPAPRRPRVKKPAVKKPAVKTPAVTTPEVKKPEVEEATAPKVRSNPGYKSPVPGTNGTPGVDAGKSGETKGE